MTGTIRISVLEPSEFARELHWLHVHRNTGRDLLRYGLHAFVPPREVRGLHVEGLNTRRILATRVAHNRVQATWTLHLAIVTTDSLILKGWMTFSSASRQADDPPYGRCLSCGVSGKTVVFPASFSNGRVRIISRADVWGGTSIETDYVHGVVDRIFTRELGRNASTPPEIAISDEEVVLRHTAPELNGIRYQFRPLIGDDKGWKELLSFARVKAAQLAAAS